MALDVVHNVQSARQLRLDLGDCRSARPRTRLLALAGWLLHKRLERGRVIRQCKLDGLQKTGRKAERLDQPGHRGFNSREGGRLNPRRPVWEFWGLKKLRQIRI